MKKKYWDEAKNAIKGDNFMISDDIINIFCNIFNHEIQIRGDIKKEDEYISY